MPLHIGITPWDLGRAHTAGWLAEQAAFAEALGFESFFLPESHFAGPGSLPEPLMLLAAVAARTRTIRLGTTSLLLPVRHPLQTAAQVAVLDQLSEGRLILGLGRGYQAPLYRAYAIPLATKRTVFEDVLAVMRRAWRGDSVVDDGEPVTLSPLPVQQPHPPLWVAAFGPKALAQTARLGLPYLASPMESIEVLAANYASLRAADTGEAPTIVPVMRTVFVSDRRAELRRVRDLLEQQRRSLASTPRGRPTANNASIDDWAIVGAPDEVAERLAMYRTRIGMTHLVATRLRLGGIDSLAARRSLVRLAQLRGELG